MKIYKTNNRIDYLNWLKENPNGYVISALNPPIAKYNVLHKSCCDSIQFLAKIDSFEDYYLKICGNL